LYFSISKTENQYYKYWRTCGNFLSIYTNEEFNFTNYNLSALDYNKLEEQDAIVVNELDEIPQALATTLKSFVEKRWDFIIPSEKSSVPNLNTFLFNFGNITFNTLENRKTNTKINFNHPIFDNVFENKVTNFNIKQINPLQYQALALLLCRIKTKVFF
jgi:hypothetical protein